MTLCPRSSPPVCCQSHTHSAERERDTLMLSFCTNMPVHLVVFRARLFQSAVVWFLGRLYKTYRWQRNQNSGGSEQTHSACARPTLPWFSLLSQLPLSLSLSVCLSVSLSLCLSLSLSLSLSHSTYIPSCFVFALCKIKKSFVNFLLTRSTD